MDAHEPAGPTRSTRCTCCASDWTCPLEQTAAFGDDLIDINMMSESGRGVAVANANPKVLSIADEICPSNNEDGVAQWIEAQLG